jgi:ParB-like chromosome segregation protein Spo0J
VKDIRFDLIRLDSGAQARAKLNQEVVAQYAAAMEEGATLPPLVVFYDGTDHWLADGFHRYHANKKIGAVTVQVDVRHGQRRDAVLHGVGANSAHGLQRTNADKRRAVEILLTDEEWRKWTDREIAKRCGVSNHLVAEVRKFLNGNSPTENETRTYITKHGIEAQRRVRHQKSAESPVKPDGQASVAAPIPSSGLGSVTVLTPDPGAALGPSPVPELQPAPKVEPDPFDPDALTYEELADFLTDAQAEVSKLTAEIKVTEADDLKAEALKWRRMYDAAQREQCKYMDLLEQAQRREAWTHRQLMRCGKAIGHDDPQKIAAAIEAFVLANRRAEA